MAEKITRRERVKATVARKPCDGVPSAYDLTNEITKQLLEHYKIELPQLSDTICEHLHYLHTHYTREPLSGGKYRDEFGTTWEWKDEMAVSMGDVGRLYEPALLEPSLAGYKFPDGSISRFNSADVAEMAQSDRFTVLGLSGLFDVCWHLRGFENFLEDMACEPEFVHELMDMATDHLISVINHAPKGFDSIRILEDWGLQKGMIMGPALWRKYLRPRLKEIYSAARAKGLTVMIHSCGDIQEIMPDLVDIGVQIVHPVQPEVMNLSLIKQEYGRDLIFYGGMGCQSTLVYGTPEDTIREAKQRVEILGEGGGYILGPAGAIPADAKIENVVALIEYAKSLC